MWKLTRQTRDDPWSAAHNITRQLNSKHANFPSISVDGLSLYFQSHRSGTTGGCDLMVATRTSISDPFANPVFLREINSGSGDFCPNISPDGLVLFFSSARPSVGGGTGPYRLWVTARASILDPFPSAQVLPPHVNEGGSGPYAGTYEPSLSPDGSALYFMSDRPGGFGGFDIWQVSITPVVDFNGDGIVAIEDLLRLIEAWGRNEPQPAGRRRAAASAQSCQLAPLSAQPVCLLWPVDSPPRVQALAKTAGQAHARRPS